MKNTSSAIRISVPSGIARIPDVNDLSPRIRSKHSEGELAGLVVTPQHPVVSDAMRA